MSQLLCLTYHYIRDRGGVFPGIHPVSKSQLSTQLTELRKRFNLVGAKDALHLLKNPNELVGSQKYVAITFDDGLIDQLDAAEVLSDFNISGMFFVSAKPVLEKKALFVNRMHYLRANNNPRKLRELYFDLLPTKYRHLKKSEELNVKARSMHIHDDEEVAIFKYFVNFILPAKVADEASINLGHQLDFNDADFCERYYISKKQIQSLLNDGHLIGNHGYSHYPMASFSLDDLLEDIEKTDSFLSGFDELTHKILSYPYGRIDAIPKHTKLIKEKFNFEAGFTLISGWNGLNNQCDTMLIRRITPNEIQQYIG